MDAEKFILTVVMSLIIAVAIRASLAVAKSFKIALPWDARIAGCPRCGAGQHVQPRTLEDASGADSPVVGGKPRSGAVDDLIKVLGVMAGIGATLVGCMLLLEGAALWVVGGSGAGAVERVLGGLLGVGAGIIAIPLGIQFGAWGWRRGFPGVVKCKACGWRDPERVSD